MNKEDIRAILQAHGRITVPIEALPDDANLFTAGMTSLASVEVMPADEFVAWLEETRSQQDAGTSPLGQELWEGSCAKCHGAEGQGGYGPRVAGSALVQDEEALATLIHNGGIKMPSVGRNWTDEEIAAVTKYVKENIGSQG